MPQRSGRKKLDPGKYTVILEPAAVADVIGWLGFALGARDAEPGQSFLSKPDETGGEGGKVGKTSLGEKLFPEFITLRSDPFHPKLSSTPWGSSLLPNEKIDWIENLVLEGQDNMLNDLIASVDRGMLVTRWWYIRVVQPKTWQLTGLTRDGVFLVEKGKVTDAVTNFRWNQRPAEVLQRTTKLTQPIRVANDETGSNMAPALITTDFNLTSISEAV